MFTNLLQKHFQKISSRLVFSSETNMTYQVRIVGITIANSIATDTTISYLSALHSKEYKRNTDRSFQMVADSIQQRLQSHLK